MAANINKTQLTDNINTLVTVLDDDIEIRVNDIPYRLQGIEADKITLILNNGEETSVPVTDELLTSIVTQSLSQIDLDEMCMGEDTCETQLINNINTMVEEPESQICVRIDGQEHWLQWIDSKSLVLREVDNDDYDATVLPVTDALLTSIVIQAFSQVDLDEMCYLRGLL